MEKFKLPPKVKAKWVKALRSGKYKQGYLSLKCGNEYCCLGVAKKIGIASYNKVLPNGHVSYKFLPCEIQSKLAAKNDSRSWSFDRIATWIEKNL